MLTTECFREVRFLVLVGETSNKRLIKYAMEGSEHGQEKEREQSFLQVCMRQLQEHICVRIRPEASSKLQATSWHPSLPSTTLIFFFMDTASSILNNHTTFFIGEIIAVGLRAIFSYSEYTLKTRKHMGIARALEQLSPFLCQVARGNGYAGRYEHVPVQRRDVSSSDFSHNDLLLGVKCNNCGAQSEGSW